MDHAFARDCGKVKRFLIYILVTNVHGQVVRALFFFYLSATRIFCVFNNAL